MENKTSVSAKQLWVIALPIIFGNLAQTLIAIIDTAFLGRLDNIALGASMMSSIYYFIWATIPWGFAMGFQILVSRRYGEKNYDRIGVIFQHGSRIIAVMALVLFVSMYMFTPYVLRQVISSPNILSASEAFMSYRVFGIIFVCFNYLCRYFFIGISNTKIISVTTLVMAVVNIILDYCLIFGEFGFSKMGVAGAALASVIAEACALAVFIIYFLFFFHHKKYLLFTYHKFEVWLVGQLAQLSIPTMLQRLLGIGIWFVFFTFVEHMGELPIAISGVIRSLYMLLSVAIFAFAATSNTIVSQLMGADKVSEIYPTVRKIILLSYSVLIPILIVCFASPNLLLSIYTDDVVLKIACIETLHVLCIGMVLYVPAMVFFETISGTGNTSHALIVEIITLVCYFCSIYYLIKILEVGVAGAWITEIVYPAVLMCTSLVYLRFYNWQSTRI